MVGKGQYMSIKIYEFFYCSCPSLLLYQHRTMDLPYPSQKDQQLNQCLVSYRKGSLLIKDSLRNIPPAPPLSASIKRKVQQLIRQDYPFELRELSDREVISMRTEVGRDGSHQNMLHLCCRQNAIKCLEYLLKTYYQYFPAEFEWWVNEASKEKMTAAMICALTGSNQCLQLLLDTGGIDIHIIDANKLSAYQIALNSKNQEAVNMLLQYERKPKRSKLINQEYLSKQVELFPGKINCFQTIYKCLFDCLTFSNPPKDRPRRKSKSPSFLEAVGAEIGGYFVDKVSLGLSKGIIEEGDIIWKSMGEYQQSGTIGILFDNFSPFDIQDIAHPNQNLLIVLQSLSQHPWLIRRIIQQDKSKHQQFMITIHPSHTPRIVTTDSYLPFLANSFQPVFVANKKEGWPMLIQKAMAKHFGSFSILEQLSPSEMISNLTGWPVVRWEIQDNMEAFQLMQKLNVLGYMYVLQGRANSNLSCPAKPNCCFTALTFYTKGSKRMVLINCPFVDPAWVEKEKYEILALKKLRGHYNCRKQMTIWIEQQRLKQYFSFILIAPLRQGYNRFSLQANINSWLYFRVIVPKTHEDPPIFYLIDSSSQQMISLSHLQGWISEKEKVIMLPPEACQEKMASFEGKSGEYLFRVKVPQGKYVLVGWAADELRLESIQESFGEIEWVTCLRKHLQVGWSDQVQEKSICTGNYTVMMSRKHNSQVVGFSSSCEVIEGVQEGDRIKLVPADHYFYCILRGNVPSASFA